MSTLAPPRFRLESLAVWRRNALVWRRLMTASLLLHFGEPFLYLLGIGYGLGRFVGELDGIPYFTFLASGFIAWSAMNVASMESMWSVYTRMVPQQTYEAILATPAQVDDIVIGELLWCGSKSLVSGTAILAVAAVLGAVNDWTALLAIPVIFLRWSPRKSGFSFCRCSKRKGTTTTATSTATSPACLKRSHTFFRPTSRGSRLRQML